MAAPITNSSLPAGVRSTPNRSRKPECGREVPRACAHEERKHLGGIQSDKNYGGCLPGCMHSRERHIPASLAQAGRASGHAAQRSKLYVQSQQAMGTAFTIYLYVGSEEQADALFGVAFEEIDRLDRTLSNCKPDSELSRINRCEAVTTDPEMFSTRRPNGAIILGSRCRAEVLPSPSRYRLMQ